MYATKIQAFRCWLTAIILANCTTNCNERVLPVSIRTNFNILKKYMLLPKSPYRDL